MNYLHDILTFLPGIIVAVTGLIVILLSAFKKSADTAYYTVLTGTAIASVVALQALFGETGISFSGMIAYGGVSAFGAFVVLVRSEEHTSELQSRGQLV